MASSGLMPFGKGASALAVLTTLSLPPSRTSQAHPLPNRETAALASSFLQASTLAKDASILCLSAAGGSPPPFGFMLFQSVSYTHLRAHETGRNLVCRLL